MTAPPFFLYGRRHPWSSASATRVDPVTALRLE